MDKAIWATWYDLPEEGKEEYIIWLHEVFIPRELERRKFLWTAHFENDASKKRASFSLRTSDQSIPNGSKYLLLFGAALPIAFLDPSPAKRRAMLTDEERKFLGRQIGVRSCIFVEYARVNGPEIARRGPGLTPGPVIQMGAFNINTWENEEELLLWYTELRMPRMTRTSGCIGARNLVSIWGWAKHACLYEFVSLETSDKGIYRESKLSVRVVGNLIHAPGSSSRGKRIWPPVEDS